MKDEDKETTEGGTAEGQGLSTRSVHAGDTRDAHGATHTPLYTHSTFAFDSTADLLDVVGGRKTGNLTQPITTTHHGLDPRNAHCAASPTA